MADWLDTVAWIDDSGDRVICIEKLKVLHETLTELRQATQDAFEDALVIGCSEHQIRDVLARLISELDNPYRQIKAEAGLTN